MSTNRVRISKSGGGDAKYRLENIEPQFVSLVTAGANRQTKFQVVKSAAFKMVPAADATSEEKRDAQKARASQYGIEVLETGSNLSYPSGDPTSESMYGDPVNLKYPFGKDDNEPYENRIRNAIARFKQNYETYSNDGSVAKVYSRIVLAALDNGISVSYDAEDPVDALLPQNIVQRLTAAKDGEVSDEDGTQKDDDAGSLDWLDELSGSVTVLLDEAQLEHSMSKLEQSDEGDDDQQPEPGEDTSTSEPQGVKAEKAALEKAAVLEKQLRVEKTKREQAEKLNGELKAELDRLKKERDRFKTQLSKFKRGVGGATAIVTGVLSESPKSDTDTRPAWNAGQDMAPKLDK